MVEIEAFMEFAVAYWAKVWRVRISLAKVTGALHKTLIECTVTQSEHVAKLVSGGLNDSL